jgi:flagellar protein FliO/FliZ
VGEISDKELVDSMNLYADKNDNTKRPRSFSDILSIFMPNSNPNLKSQNVYGSSSFNASELLRKQRERLNENMEGEQ